MRMKIAEITIEGDGGVKRYRSKRGFIVKEKIKVFSMN